MVRFIAKKTLASDAEQYHFMVKLFLKEYFHQEKLESVCSAIELYRNVLKSHV